MSNALRHVRCLRLACPLVALVALVTIAAGPIEASPSVGTKVDLPLAPVQSIFYIAKSENKNEVHYGVKVDGACKPVGARPVYGYWIERERGPNVTSPLLDREQRAYGLNEPRSIKRLASSTEILVSLRAFPDRPLIVQVFRAGDRCFARTITKIQRQSALLQSIYIDLGFLFTVNYAQLTGVRVQDGQRVQEKLHE